MIVNRGFFLSTHISCFAPRKEKETLWWLLRKSLGSLTRSCSIRSCRRSIASATQDNLYKNEKKSPAGFKNDDQHRMTAQTRWSVACHIGFPCWSVQGNPAKLAGRMGPKHVVQMNWGNQPRRPASEFAVSEPAGKGMRPQLRRETLT